MSNTFIKIDYNKVKGYEKLSPKSKIMFQKVYELHNKCQGNDYKASFIPLSVKQDGDKLKVTFKNCWLHYYANGTWG